MRKLLLKLIDSDLGIVARLSAIIFLCGMTGVLAVAPIHAEFPQSNRDEFSSSVQLQDEHRFSVLETKMDSLKDSIDDLETKKWLELLMITGLLGERGVQIIKNRKP